MQQPKQAKAASSSRTIICIFINWRVEQGKIREISVRKYNIRQIRAVKLLMLDKVRSFDLCKEARNLPKSHPLSNYFDSLKINKIFHVLSKLLPLNSVSVYFRKVNYHILWDKAEWKVYYSCGKCRIIEFQSSKSLIMVIHTRMLQMKKLRPRDVKWVSWRQTLWDN